MPQAGKIRRAQVQRYNKSGKLAAIYRQAGYVGWTVLELSSNMKSITNVRHPRYVKGDTFSPTIYQVEIAQEQIGREGDNTVFSYRLIRVLAPEDTDLCRWVSTESLDELPVSPEENFTPEERAWAGEREGDIGWGIAIGIIALGAAALCVNGYVEKSSYLPFAFVFLVAGYFFIRYPWKIPKRALPSRLEHLRAHKANLRRQATDHFTKAKTVFEAALKNFATWEQLSPKHFETAVSLKLQAEGFTVKITKYSGDGGVDVEAVDNHGRPVIVQAKKYRQRVGVSVVREMIGVRESRPDKPRTIIYSLAGFTRGAQRLAESSGIELRDVRTDLLQL